MRCLFLIYLYLTLLPSAAFAMDHRAIAEYFAPHIYQQTSSPTPLKEDYFTAFDYDSDWRNDNNEANLAYYPMRPVVYYSVQETGTHYFTGYYLYYPRTFGQQAGIITGFMLAIVKEGTKGTTVGIATYNHLDWQWQKTPLQPISVPASFTITPSSHKSRRIEYFGGRTQLKGVKYAYHGKVFLTSGSYQLLPIEILQEGLQRPQQSLPSHLTAYLPPTPPWRWGGNDKDLWNYPAESFARYISSISVRPNNKTHP